MERIWLKSLDINTLFAGRIGFGTRTEDTVWPGKDDAGAVPTNPTATHCLLEFIIEKTRKTNDNGVLRAAGGCPVAMFVRRLPMAMLEKVMKQMRTIGILAFVTCIALMGPLTRASFHNWEIQEVYTNYDGSVQFINLFTTSGFETQLSGQQIQATSDGMTKTFTFNANAPNTTNKHLLIATPGFASLTSPIAVSADFTFPVPTLFDRFFEPDATNITINFVGADSVTFTGALLPKDGVNALHFTIAGAASVAANMPTNFAGATGSVNLPPPMTTGDYNGDTFVNAADYTVWRNTLGQDVAMNGDGADGDADGEIDLGDYNFWKSRYGDVVGGAGAGQAAVSQVPEPTTLAMAVAILSVLPVRFDRRSARRAVRK